MTVLPVGGILESHAVSDRRMDTEAKKYPNSWCCFSHQISVPSSNNFRLTIINRKLLNLRLCVLLSGNGDLDVFVYLNLTVALPEIAPP